MAEMTTDLDPMVAAIGGLSDQKPEVLTAFGKLFIEAHEAAPCGLSVEVGTRSGGSALFFLRLLERIYPDAVLRPMLFTVDPYGGKPYNAGDHLVAGYGDEHYLKAKQALAPYPNHAHFHMKSSEFFFHLYGISYWQNGSSRSVANLSFCLLDGDHDLESIKYDLGCLRTWVNLNGIVVIDDVESDPNTIQWLRDQRDFKVMKATPQWMALRLK